MRTIRRQLTDIHLPYPLDREAPLSKILFMDIETTGFTARNSILYLIGCAFFENGQPSNGWPLPVKKKKKSSRLSFPLRQITPI